MVEEIKEFDKNTHFGLIESFLEKRKEAYSHLSKESKNWFLWKFYKRPIERSILSCIFAGDEIFGCNSFSHYPLVYNDKKIKGLLAYENFVHPKFQRRGMFKKMIQLSETISQKEKFSLLMAFPNSKSLPGYIKRNWIHVDNYINYWIKPFLSFNMIINFLDIKKPFIKSSNRIKNNFNFGDFNTDFYQNIITSKWDKKSLEWRFNEMPQSEYNYFNNEQFESVVRMGKRGKLNELQILYLNPKSSRFMRKDFSDFIIKLKFQRKVDLISFPISKDNPFDQKMNFIGFLKFKSKTNFVYKLNDSSLSKVKISLSGIDFHTY